MERGAHARLAHEADVDSVATGSRSLVERRHRVVEVVLELVDRLDGQTVLAPPVQELQRDDART